MEIGLPVPEKIFKGFYHIWAWQPSWSYQQIFISLYQKAYMSCVMRKPTFWFPTWSDTNLAVQPQKMARGLTFRIWKIEGLYYLCSENKAADQLRGYHEADLCLSFRICKMLHDAAHIQNLVKTAQWFLRNAFFYFHTLIALGQGQEMTLTVNTHIPS